MAKGTSKRANKPPPSSAPSSADPKFSVFNASASHPVIPLQPPSPTLLPFLSTLPQGPVYILHIDTFPSSHKKKAFTVPLLLNTFLALLLLWRASVALPAYVSLLAATLGLESPAAINVPDTPWGALLALSARRAGMFAVDFMLIRVVALWPWGFFWGWNGEGGVGAPVRWRWEVGFQEKEVVVRRSRGGWWGTEVSERGGGEAGLRRRLEREGERIWSAVEKGWVDARTGYAMLNRDWELDFKGMVGAHGLLKSGEVSWDDFERKVVGWTKEEGWLVWEVGREEREEREGDGRRDGGSMGREEAERAKRI